MQWIWLALRRSPISFARVVSHLWPDRVLLVKLVRIGIPTGVQIMVVSLAELAVLAFVNRFGSSATGAFGAVNQLLTYIQFPASCIAAAAAVFACAIHRRQSVSSAFCQSHEPASHSISRSAAARLRCAMYFLARCLSLFLTQSATIDVAQSLMFIALWSYVAYGATSVLAGLMRSNGTVLWPTAISVLGIWAVQVPVAWVLSIGPLGLAGIWMAYPVAFICALVAVAVYYRRAWLPSLGSLGASSS